ncbi:MAG: hypothetical protein ACFFEF_08670 [Candidatus Thorarchaeota archaeon]
MFLVIGSFGFFVLPTSTLENGFYESNTMEWAQILGTVLVYRFMILADFGTEDVFQYWFPLNNSRILVRISDLPNLNSSMCTEWYIENIGDSGKVKVSSISSMHIIYSLRSILERTLSKLIFPIGDWEFFDDHFENELTIMDEEGEYPRYYRYQGKSYDESIYTFMAGWYQQESDVGMYISSSYGEIEKSTGIPNFISHYWLFLHPNGFDYEIILTRTQFEDIKESAWEL